MRKPKLLLWLPLALATGGCIDPEPYTRPGTWQATGANDANLRAMLVDPSQLERGVAPAVPTTGEAAALAAARLGGPQAGGGQGGASAGAQPVRGIPALPPVSGQYVGN